MYVCVCALCGLQEELESLPLNSIVELRAVMDSEVYHSLLTMCVKVRRTSSVFLFQCDELKVRGRDLPTHPYGSVDALARHSITVNVYVFSALLQADFIKKDLSRALLRSQKEN